MITLTNITVSIDNKPILQNISCTIQAGDFIVMVGNNGAGKSTFFDVLTGKRKPDSGTIMFDDKDITHLSEQERALFIARLFQNPQLNGVSSMTVEQNLALSMYKGRTATLANGLSNLDQLPNVSTLLEGDIAHFLKLPMRSLSGGQRQLVAFIMATNALPPQLLLLDEPTAALDPEAATKLLKYALQYIKSHRITTLLITHDPQLALAIGNRVWIIENGYLSKQYNYQEKQYLSADNLVGHIAYCQLA